MVVYRCMRCAHAGGSASFEGWGASGSASYKSLSSLHITTKDLTAMASMVYLSDPVTIIDPANEMADVGLTPSAIDYMQNHGPVAWHAKYGSHFISGYTKGWCVRRVERVGCAASLRTAGMA